MQTKKRSPIAAIVLAVIIGLLVIALLNGVIRPTQVVVAKVSIAPGTILTDQLVELHTIPMGAKPTDAITKLADAIGKSVAVARTPGDYIVTSFLGDIAGAGIPAELAEGHVAIAIHVDLASGVAGLLRPGQTVTVIGMLSPDVIKESNSTVLTAPISEFTSTEVSSIPEAGATPTPTPTPLPPSSPLARLAITGLRVLMVPQSFRYEELPTGTSQDQLYSAAQSSASAQEGSCDCFGCSDRSGRSDTRFQGRPCDAAGSFGSIWHHPPGAGADLRIGPGCIGCDYSQSGRSLQRNER